MKINFGQVEDAKDITKLKPEGDYVCKITKVKESSGAESGNIMWTVWWQIQQGDYENQYIFDHLFFTEGGLKRMKLVLARLGFNVEGELEVDPDMLIGKYALVTIDHKKQEKGKNAGKMGENVPFHGIQAVEVTVEEDDDDSDEPSF
jgi:hypothetical protein